MQEKPNYYAIIPAEIRYDNELCDKAKLLYGEIVALTNKEGCCWATNNYFAELYDISKLRVSRLIQQLVQKKYITSEIKYKKGSKEIEGRYIKIYTPPYIQKCIYPIYKNEYTPIFKNDTDNNININNTSINIKKINKKSFQKPTIDEIQEYCKERNNGINAEAFYDFYESKNWYIGKNKMQDWRACVRTWEKRNNQQVKKQPIWLDKEIKQEVASSQEQKEIEDFLKEWK